jgi:predicted acetyltransferase
MSDLTVAVAAPQERTALENLLQLYTHDFSEHWSNRPEGELGEDGRFPDYPLDAYWREETHVPLLLRWKGRLVGFALLDGSSHTGRPVDRNMAEFFIARKHRRGGVGTAAAQTIFSRYPGLWEVAVVRRNAAALSFWRRAVAGHPRTEDLEESDIMTPAWNGPVLRFRIR